MGESLRKARESCEAKGESFCFDKGNAGNDPAVRVDMLPKILRAVADQTGSTYLSDAIDVKPQVPESQCKGPSSLPKDPAPGSAEPPRGFYKWNGRNLPNKCSGCGKCHGDDKIWASIAQRIASSLVHFNVVE